MVVVVSMVGVQVGRGGAASSDRTAIRLANWLIISFETN